MHYHPVELGVGRCRPVCKGVCKYRPCKYLLCHEILVSKVLLLLGLEIELDVASGLLSSEESFQFIDTYPQRIKYSFLESPPFQLFMVWYHHSASVRMF
jgi:hypothetical protein